MADQRGILIGEDTEENVVFLSQIPDDRAGVSEEVRKFLFTRLSPRRSRGAPASAGP